MIKKWTGWDLSSMSYVSRASILDTNDSKKPTEAVGSNPTRSIIYCEESTVLIRIQFR